MFGKKKITALLSLIKIFHTWVKTHYFIVHILIVLIVPSLLLAGNLFEIINRYGDPSNFFCYATAFWHGNGQIFKDPLKFAYCQSTAVLFNAHPFHTLPSEYPILSLIPFSLPLLFIVGWYQLTFGFWMIIVVIGFYFYLALRVSKKSSLLFLFLLLIGASRTAATRFDMLPAIAIFFCLVAASQKKFLFGYILLAIATFLKLYPILLLVPLYIAEQQSFSQPISLLRKFSGIIVFTIICAVFVSFSFLINGNIRLTAFDYYQHRPIEFESLAANSIWILSLFRLTPFCIGYTYGSTNVYEQTHGNGKVCPAPFTSYHSLSISHALEIIFPLLLFFGVLWVIKLQRDKKMSLSQTFISIILLILITGKVFSAQFLIWLIPLIVYVQGYNLIWLILWTAVSLTTTILYPSLISLYLQTNTNLIPSLFWKNIYFSVLTVRNGLLVILTLYHLFFMKKFFRHYEVEKKPA